MVYIPSDVKNYLESSGQSTEPTDFSNSVQDFIDNIGSAIPFIGNFFSSNKADKNIKKEFEMQKYLQDDAQEFGREMTASQNEWNSAPEQMKRLLEAGVSPAAAAQGLAGSSGVTAASSPSGIASAPNIASYMSAAAEASKDRATERLLGSQTLQQDIINQYLPSVQQVTIDKLTAEAKQAEEAGKYTAEQTRQLIDFYDVTKDVKYQELSNLQQALLNAQEELQVYAEQIKVFEPQYFQQ